MTLVLKIEDADELIFEATSGRMTEVVEPSLNVAILKETFGL
jgi:hypothetical protein